MLNNHGRRLKDSDVTNNDNDGGGLQMMMMPHDDGPNIMSSSTGTTLHSVAMDYNSEAEEDESSIIIPPPSSSSLSNSHHTIVQQQQQQQQRPNNPLKLWPLAVLVFYNVSGGPFGIEPSIRAAGNFYAILGFLIFPFVRAVPEALVTAELGAAFQDPSAGVAWVEAAFGEGLGSLTGYFGWLAGATDNAIYPTLFMEYVSSAAGWSKDEFGGMTRFVSIAAITIILALINYTGLEIVGNASLVICVIALSPFVIMTIIGTPKIVPSRWFQLPESVEDGSSELFDDSFQTNPGPLPILTLGGIIWRPFLNNMFWNLNSFDAAASFASETTSVGTTFPRGMFIGLAMVVLGYLVPLLVAVGATDYSQEDWVDGFLANVAVDIGGKWLGVWTVFAAGISNIAMFEAEMSSDAFQLMGMAERGYVPHIFTTRSKYGTPTAGIIFNTLVIIAFSCADFGQLLELLNSAYSMSLLMEYAAFVKLRLYHKDCKFLKSTTLLSSPHSSHHVLQIILAHQLCSATTISYPNT